ncbi:lipoate-protein ligase [Herbihabitans rhizosphaerae]|uniref:Lipoate-protein ligase n=1 Tax=Herbihabitans rhizosphaerae TaxID=1872711 RepID=A0A4Q7L5I3_9PSEU|nr:lipoate--protein ligase family protein [Herbihabitans rhizosphaerae]RZS43522.1 lipoate-protein ligase [Herbihabitans rhizosphaerae]
MFDEIIAGWPEPAANLALDEALLRAGPRRPLVWLWRNPACVVIGRGQKIEREVELSACARDGVPVLRRASGGGTVFHDPGNLNVTTVLPDASEPLAHLGKLMSQVVTRLGLTPVLGDRGLFVDGAKLCGFAAFRTRTGALAHSTLLIDTDADLVGEYLTPQPSDKRPLDSHRSPVASLADHGVRPSAEELDAIVAEVLEVDRRRPPTDEESDWQRRLRETRYDNPDWHRTGARGQVGQRSAGSSR